jgi:hypothetical protein
LQQNFIVTFSFENEKPNIDANLKYIRGRIFIKEPEFKLTTEEQHGNKHTVKELLSCYHVHKDTLEEDDPRDIQIEEAKVKEKWRVHL